MKERGDAPEQASEVVSSYINKELGRVVTRVEKIRAGNKDLCCCPNCMKEAVREANDTLSMVTPDDQVYEMYHYEIVADERGIRIEQGCQFPKEIYDSDSETGLSEE